MAPWLVVGESLSRRDAVVVWSGCWRRPHAFRSMREPAKEALPFLRRFDLSVGHEAPAGALAHAVRELPESSAGPQRLGEARKGIRQSR
jgi:hypothetical protein